MSQDPTDFSGHVPSDQVIPDPVQAIPDPVLRDRCVQYSLGINHEDVNTMLRDAKIIQEFILTGKVPYDELTSPLSF
jgi:hypothetical protein